MGGAPTGLTAELDKPFGERVLDPLLQRFQTLGRRLTGADQEERIRPTRPRRQPLRLDRRPRALGQGARRDRRVRCPSTSALLSGRSPWALLAMAAASPSASRRRHLLYNAATKRDAEMQKAMADAIDLDISVEAGLGFDAALQQVAKNTEGPLAGEFQRVLQEMQIGRGRSEHAGAGDRTRLPDLRSFVGAMVQADSFGIPIGQVLRVQSAEIRIKRRQRARRKPHRFRSRSWFRSLLFIPPCLLVMVIGPAGRIGGVSL